MSFLPPLSSVDTPQSATLLNSLESSYRLPSAIRPPLLPQPPPGGSSAILRWLSRLGLAVGIISTLGNLINDNSGTVPPPNTSGPSINEVTLPPRNYTTVFEYPSGTNITMVFRTRPSPTGTWTTRYCGGVLSLPGTPLPIEDYYLRMWSQYSLWELRSNSSISWPSSNYVEAYLKSVSKSVGSKYRSDPNKLTDIEITGWLIAPNHIIPHYPPNPIPNPTRPNPIPVRSTRHPNPGSGGLVPPLNRPSVPSAPIPEREPVPTEVPVNRPRYVPHLWNNPGETNHPNPIATPNRTNVPTHNRTPLPTPSRTRSPTRSRPRYPSIHPRVPRTPQVLPPVPTPPIPEGPPLPTNLIPTPQLRSTPTMPSVPGLVNVSPPTALARPLPTQLANTPRPSSDPCQGNSCGGNILSNVQTGNDLIQNILDLLDQLSEDFTQTDRDTLNEIRDKVFEEPDPPAEGQGPATQQNLLEVVKILLYSVSASVHNGTHLSKAAKQDIASSYSNLVSLLNPVLTGSGNTPINLPSVSESEVENVIELSSQLSSDGELRDSSKQGSRLAILASNLYHDHVQHWVSVTTGLENILVTLGKLNNALFKTGKLSVRHSDITADTFRLATQLQDNLDGIQDNEQSVAQSRDYHQYLLDDLKLKSETSADIASLVNRLETSNQENSQEIVDRYEGDKAISVSPAIPEISHYPE